MSNLTILTNKIRTLDNLYSLNDLHRASGSDKNHQPAFFIRNAQTQELIAEIERPANSQIAVKTVRGGRNPELQGSWACEELALAYAMWISPKFHLVVLRAFIAMHKGENLQNAQQNLPLPLPNPTVNREFKDVMMKILNYAMHYEQFQKSITSSENAKRQKQIEFLFSKIPDGDSYLFVFRQEISQDIQKASDLLFALNFS